MFRHQADFRPVRVQVVQPEQHGGRNAGELAGSQVAGAHEEHLVLLLHPGQAENVHADGNARAHQHVQHPVEGLIQGMLNVRVGDHHADEHDGRQAGGVRLADEHRAVQRNQDAQAHQRVKRERILAQRRNQRHEQQEQKAPESADQGARQPVQRVFLRILYVGLQADDGGDGGFGGHGFPPIPPQAVKHQAQKHRDAGFDDPLPKGREV